MDVASKNSGNRRLTLPPWLGFGLLWMGGLALLKHYLFRDVPGFEPLRFHPIWVWVLLVSSRFGFWPGLASAALSAFFYLWTYHWGIASRQELFAFFFVAWVLGEIRHRLTQREVTLHEKLSQVERQLDLRTRELAEETHLRQLLEERIAGEIATFMSLYTSAKRLTSVNPELLRRGAMEVLRDDLKVIQGGLYERAREGFARAAQIADTGETSAPALVTEKEPLLSLLLHRKSVVNVRDLLLTEKETTHYPFLAMAPVLDRRGEVTALITIEKIDFLRFSQVTMRLLGMLADWLSQSFEQAALLQNSRQQGLFHPELEVLSYACLRVLASRSKAWTVPGTDASVPGTVHPLGPVARIQTSPADGLSEEIQLKVMASLLVLVQTGASPKDIVFQGASPHEIVLWCPGRTLDSLEARLQELSASFRALALQPMPDQQALSLEWEMMSLPELAERLAP